LPKAFDLVDGEPDEEEEGEHVRPHEHVEDQLIVVRQCACPQFPTIKKKIVLIMESSVRFCICDSYRRETLLMCHAKVGFSFLYDGFLRTRIALSHKKEVTIRRIIQ
jgi:hypothetical protein